MNPLDPNNRTQSQLPTSINGAVAPQPLQPTIPTNSKEASGSRIPIIVKPADLGLGRINGSGRP